MIRPTFRSARRARLAALFVLVVTLTATIPAAGAAAPPENAAAPVALFNGRDLTGWVNVNCAPGTWSVRDGMLVCSGNPRGFLRTDTMYENYVLELEWRHVRPKGNAGLFVHADALPQVGAMYPRSVEVQVMDGDHGSIFGIRGCKVTPLTNPAPRAKGGRARPTANRNRPAGEWNRYVLTSKDGTLALEVNGEVVTRVTGCSQVKGYVALEAELSEAHFRNIRLTPLPGSDPPAEKVAQVDEGLRSMFDGQSFAGWRHPPEFVGHWTAADGVIACDGKVKVAKGQTRDLWSEKEFRDFVLVVDWRLPRKPVAKARPTFTPDGLFVRDAAGQVVRREIPDAGDSGVHLRGSQRYQVNIWSQPMGSGDINELHKDASLAEDVRRTFMPASRADAPFGQWNRFVITLKGDRVTVVLNGQTVIDRATLPAVPPTGRLGLQNHGDPIQFRNLFIKELAKEP